MNSKIVPNKKNSAILLASVLMVGFIGISSHFSIFAQEYHDGYEAEEYSQYYNDDYESEYNNYEKYMKDDNPRPISKTISCDNINNNNIDFGDATNDEAISSTNGDSQSDQRIDRMNNNGLSDKKGDFVDPCVNNNNIKFITNNFNTNNFNTNNGTTINNNTLNIENNNAQAQAIDLQQDACINAAATDVASSVGLTTGDINNTTLSFDLPNDIDVNQSNNCTVTQSQTATNANQSIADNDSVVLSSSSIASVEQPQAQTQQVRVLQDGNGVEINQQGNQPIDIKQIKSSQDDNGIEIQQQGSLPIYMIQQLENSPIKGSHIISHGTGDSPELTALEKSTKLKQQWLELLP